LRVYFIDLMHPSGMNNTNVMPLGMGLIAAYCQKMLHPHVVLEAEIYKLPDDLNRALTEKPLPDVACLSNWAWNQRLQLAYARHLKRLKPEIPIIMGGLNLPLDRAGRETFLRAHPEVDFHVIGEGEESMWLLLDQLSACDMDARRLHYQPEGCCYLGAEDHHGQCPNGEYREKMGYRQADIDDIPSPYLAGLMDKFFAQGLRPIVETARGCPFSCIFCAGAGESSNRVVHHSPAYIEAELDYVARKVKEVGIAPDLIYADLNFGMYPQDLEKARIFRRVIDTYGWPRTISGSTGKARPERVLETISIINHGPDGEDQGVLKFASSIQSTDPEVLSLCLRQNFPMEKLKQLMEERPPGGQTEYFSELILGLPGDTRERHYGSLRACVDTLRINLITTHQLMVLPGTPLATPELREAHGIKTRWRPLVGCAGIYKIGEENVSVAELEEIALESATMNFKDHVDCREMDLLTKVYIDRDGFIEIFGMIRKLGLSCFELLRRVRSEWRQSPVLRRLLHAFHLATIWPFCTSQEEALQLVSKKEYVEGLLRGEHGTNEMLVYRAKAMMDHIEAIHIALWEAALKYVHDKRRYSDIRARYIDQAITWSRLRKFYPSLWYDSGGPEANFDFDFISAAEKGFEVHPEEIILPSTRRYRFINTPEMNIRIHDTINWWLRGCETEAQKDFAWGRLYHIVNTKTLDRTPALMEE
jgi:radical SAM superfamily enzyme YgiQ (UPF0313 family)